MKIAFFADNFYPELSGIADSILLTGVELARRGHEIHYFVPKYSQKDYKTSLVEYKELELGDNVKIHRLPSFKYPTPTMQGRLVLPNIFRGLSGKKFDIIHTHSFFGPGLDALLFARIKNIPIIGTNHTIIKEFVRYSPIHNNLVDRATLGYVKWYYNRLALVSTPSNFLAKDMRENGLQTSAVAVSNPIDPGFSNFSKSREALKKELGLSAFTVLHAGRISAEKGVETLFKGFLDFAKKVPEAGLVIVGQGALRSVLEKESRATGLEKRVKFLGPYLGENKKKLYEIFQASDVFATASTSESQCMSMLQAMAVGIPVIGARAAALPEYITSDRGLLFTSGNAEELAKSLLVLEKDVSFREKLGKSAKSFAETLSVGAIANVWENIYNDNLRPSQK